MRGKKKKAVKTKVKKTKKIGKSTKAATMRGAAGRSSSLPIKGPLRANLMAAAEKAGVKNWKDHAIERLSNI